MSYTSNNTDEALTVYLDSERLSFEERRGAITILFTQWVNTHSIGEMTDTVRLVIKRKKALQVEYNKPIERVLYDVLIQELERLVETLTTELPSVIREMLTQRFPEYILLYRLQRERSVLRVHRVTDKKGYKLC